MEYNADHADVSKLFLDLDVECGLSVQVAVSSVSINTVRGWARPPVVRRLGTLGMISICQPYRSQVTPPTQILGSYILYSNSNWGMSMNTYIESCYYTFLCGDKMWATVPISGRDKYYNITGVPWGSVTSCYPVRRSPACARRTAARC